MWLKYCQFGIKQYPINQYRAGEVQYSAGTFLKDTESIF